MIMRSFDVIASELRQRKVPVLEPRWLEPSRDVRRMSLVKWAGPVHQQTTLYNVSPSVQSRFLPALVKVDFLAQC